MPPRRRATLVRPTSTHAVAYVRVSTEEQADVGMSLDAQEARLRAYCTLRSLNLASVYRDEAVSGGKPFAGRPAGTALLAALAAGDVAHVVVTKLDRAFRSAVDCLGTVEEWRGAGIALHLVDMGGQAVDTSSAMGEFFLLLMAGMAQWELATIRERTRTALQHKRARGERLGADPLGLATPAPGTAWEPVLDELSAVRHVLARRQTRGARPDVTFRAIAGELAAAGYRTKRGGLWHASTVRAVWERRGLYAALLSSTPIETSDASRRSHAA